MYSHIESLKYIPYVSKDLCICMHASSPFFLSLTLSYRIQELTKSR